MGRLAVRIPSQPAAAGIGQPISFLQLQQLQDLANSSAVATPTAAMQLRMQQQLWRRSRLLAPHVEACELL
jgi:hypothetical protein